MSRPRKPGQAVEHSYITPVEIEEGGRCHKIGRNIDELISYVFSVTGKVGCGVIMAICILIPVSMIVMGIMFYEGCPVEKNITKYLIIGGVAALLCIMIRSFTKDCPGLLAILILFSVAWFIAGSVWIFSIFKPERDKNTGQNFCDEHLYLYAYWMTIVQHIFALFVVIYLCVLCYYQ